VVDAMSVHGTISAFPESDDDAAYEDFRDRVDRGEQCPTCHLRIPVRRETACGVELFCCVRCKARWFDLWTQPSEEA
jgi:endogenous inhibitor of DNA gyrase (YacG/DUF329 family)